MSKCTDLVINLAKERGLEIPDEELDLLIKNFEGQLKRRSIKSSADQELAFDIARNNTTEMRLAARQAKREALIKASRRNNINARLDAYDGSDYNGYYTQLLGESKMRAGSRDSAESRSKGTENLLFNTLLRALNQKGGHLQKVLTDGKIDAEIYAYAYDRNAKVSQEAKDIHDVIYNHSNGTRERVNRAGAFIGEREDHLGFSQSALHGSDQIRKAGPVTYKADLRRLLHEDTFKNFNSETEINAYIDDLYKRFVTGKHYLVDDGAQDLVGRPKSINLAKKLSQARSLHFKDGASAFEYATKYSEGTIWDKLASRIQQDARKITMLEMYGPNPKAMHEAIKLDIEKRLFDKGEVLTDMNKKALDAAFAKMNGELDIPGNASLAKISFNIRALENMSKLGGAVLSAFSDVVFKGATLNRRTNLGFFGSYSRTFEGLISRVPKADREHVRSMAAVYHEAVLGSMHLRAGALDSMPGRVSKAQETFFKWSALTRWTNGHKDGVVEAVAHDLARYRNTPFAELPEKTRRNLELHNITADEWSVVDKMETQAPETGNHYVLAPQVYDLADDVIDPVIARQRGTTDITDSMRMQFKDEFATKIQGLLSDIADEGVITPGPREQVAMTFGTQKGTYLGEFLRYVMQFKSFPVTVITKQMLPAYYGAGGGLKGFAALAPLIVATTIFGYLTGVAKDALKGRKPKDPKALKTWKEALIRGGGLGIYGDFLFQEYSKYGRSFQETAFGPAIGTFSDALALAYKSATLDADAGDYFRFIKGITPYSNLFYTEMAMNYLLFYNFMEAADPGYLSRMERARRRDFNQEYWLPPTSVAR